MEKKNKKRKIKIISIIILCLVIRVPILIYQGMWPVGFFYALTHKTDISHIPIGISYTIKYPSDLSDLSEQSEVDMVWYDDVEKAIYDVSAIKDMSKYRSEEIINQYPIGLYVYGESYSYLYMIRRVNEEGTVGYHGVQMCGEYKAGKYSQPLYIWTALIEQSVENPYYIYDFDDIIAQSIIHKLAMGRPIFDENDNQVFYGVVKDKEELESLTIDGNPVDEIIPIETQDGMYYFWSYSKTRIAEKLDIDMGEFRYQEVIDQLEIKYDKQEEE